MDRAEDVESETPAVLSLIAFICTLHQLTVQRRSSPPRMSAVRCIWLVIWSAVKMDAVTCSEIATFFHGVQAEAVLGDMCANVKRLQAGWTAGRKVPPPHLKAVYSCAHC